MRIVGADSVVARERVVLTGAIASRQAQTGKAPVQRLADRVSAVFPDYPANNPHVPTFRQCFTHTSGLSGHGEFGGMRNPHFENVILNGIDANRPGAVYEYSGMGYDLAAKAMEIVGGKSAVRLYHEHLFQPLGFNEVLITDANAGAHLTALELGFATAQLTSVILADLPPAQSGEGSASKAPHARTAPPSAAPSSACMPRKTMR